jgi:GNAT superfamily N-acetyltransferase
LTIERVAEADLAELLPLMRGYCDFYAVAPSDEALLALSRSLIADPEREGVQLLARNEGRAVGFATIFWTWATTSAERIGVMNDLFVAPEARGTGVAEALIEASRAECAAHGAGKLTWQTAPDNAAAIKVYDRVGATREHWVDYWLPVDRSGESIGDPPDAA